MLENIIFGNAYEYPFSNQSVAMLCWLVSLILQKNGVQFRVKYPGTIEFLINRFVVTTGPTVCYLLSHVFNK